MFGLEYTEFSKRFDELVHVPTFRQAKRYLFDTYYRYADVLALFKDVRYEPTLDTYEQLFLLHMRYEKAEMALMETLKQLVYYRALEYQQRKWDGLLQVVEDCRNEQKDVQAQFVLLLTHIIV